MMKYNSATIIDAIYFDGTQKFFYLKRFQPECNEKMQQYIDDDCTLKQLAYDSRSIIRVTFGGANATRPDEDIDPAEFVGVKSHRAKGKRITTFDVATIAFVEGVKPEPTPAESEESAEEDEPMENIATTTETDDMDVEFEVVRGDEEGEEQQLNLF